MLTPDERLRQQVAEQQVQETKILQKVRGVQRDAFEIRYPTQISHCLRLVMERLQLNLDKRGGVVVTDPDSWPINSAEICDLAEAAYY